MSVRTALRLKVVLPVTIFHDREKQVAHTLDAASNSARLAGLCLPIEPGDTIEIQRNASRAKFKVYWVGAPGSLLAGQAGVRALPGSKTIWTPDFPQDAPDLNCDPQHLRSGLPLVRSLHPATPKEDVPTRQEFKGGASIRATGYSHAIYAQISDVSQYGAQLKTPFVLPPNTELFVLFNLNGVVVEVPGFVRTSDALAGMEVGFQKMSAVTQDKLRMALGSVEQPSLDVASAPVAQEQPDHMPLAI